MLDVATSHTVYTYVPEHHRTKLDVLFNWRNRPGYDVTVYPTSTEVTGA